MGRARTVARGSIAVTTQQVWTPFGHGPVQRATAGDSFISSRVSLELSMPGECVRALLHLTSSVWFLYNTFHTPLPPA